MTMSKFNNRGNTRHGTRPGSDASKPVGAELELDEEGDMPTLRMLPACRKHAIHPPCGTCGNCTGDEERRGWNADRKEFECLACRIFRTMGWNGSSAPT